MGKSVLELFNQKEILNYQKDRVYPKMLGEELFPEVKKRSLKFDMIVNKSKTPVIASVHGFDTESEIGQRKAQKMAIELALIKRKLPLSEEEIIALEAPRNDAEKEELMQEVYDDIDTLVQGVRARVELMRMEILSNGTVTLDENGLDAVIDYGVPSEHKVANVDWGATSNPINDMLSWYNKMTVKPKRVLTSNTVLAKILSNKNVVNALFGKDTTRIASLGELNNYLESLQLPKIYTYDEVYRKVKEDGTEDVLRYFPENAFVMFPDGKLGETLYGPTAEEIRLQRDPSVDIRQVGKILAMIYEEDKDPVSTWEKAVATALPSFPYSNEVFQAKISLN